MIFDAIIIGSGIAGCTVAYYLAKDGWLVGLMNKNNMMTESNTYYAQGGIAFVPENDKKEIFYEDIMNAGAGICNPEAVKIVTEEAYSAVMEVLINNFKVNFSKNEKGEFDLTDEAAHSTRRILHSYDTTGKTIEESAIKTLKKEKNLIFLNDYTAIDIITSDHHSLDKLRMYKDSTALGVYALNNRNNKVEKILSKVVILASGGLGRLYLHTTNPPFATGDGYAMAARAGAKLINMEYTQFHPTTLYHFKANNFLISESVRGEGGIIINHLGKPFMEKYHPLKDLAPRDIVTRAILSEMLDNGVDHVYLDITIIGKEKIKKRFPNIYKECKKYGYDITQEPIPIVPAFHFSCGGILTDMEGKTSISRLFAVGEVACTGLHGANRLASTSLLEGVVFGRRISYYLIKNKNDYLSFDFPEIPEWIDTGIETIDPALINQDWTLLRSIMWNYVGAIRTKKRLRRAIIDLKNLKEDIENFYRDAKINKSIIELRNAVQTGLIIAEQALSNRNSIGAHYRID